ncbi:MAG: peptidoglycan-binding domain-containing protein [Candidatus Eremiobacteraeota bacterium]|nr:peptidoglycan-binding domain-containing protein [Candidatus Eremiobacteraeota bacterium]
MAGTLPMNIPTGSSPLQASPSLTAEVQQRQQARETRLGQESMPQVESLSDKEINELNGFYNKVTGHIEQIRFPEALKGQSFIRDGSDPELLGLIQQLLERAPELQGSSLASNAKSGRVSASDIKELQSFLESKGYSVGSTGIDGLYGPRTHHAMEGFLTGRAPDSGNSTMGQGRGGTTGQAGDTPAHNPPAGTKSTHHTTGAPGTTGTGSGQSTGAPPGYQTIKGQVPAGVAEKAKSLLGGDYGTETPFQLDGKNYMTRVEHHYHPPGYVGGPTGWHKGVTVYEQKP